MATTITENLKRLIVKKGGDASHVHNIADAVKQLVVIAGGSKSGIRNIAEGVKALTIATPEPTPPPPPHVEKAEVTLTYTWNEDDYNQVGMQYNDATLGERNIDLELESSTYTSETFDFEPSGYGTNIFIYEKEAGASGDTVDVLFNGSSVGTAQREEVVDGRYMVTLIFRAPDEDGADGGFTFVPTFSNGKTVSITISDRTGYYLDNDPEYWIDSYE